MAFYGTHHWIDRAEYPFRSHHFPTPSGDMHYVDEGSGEVIVFVHGNPSWSFLYRHLIKALSRDHRCIALDNLGFGLSDKPANADYSPRSHSENLTRLIDTLGLKDITLVLHDWGGAIGMGYALEHPGTSSGSSSSTTRFGRCAG